MRDFNLRMVDFNFLIVGFKIST